MREDVKSFYLEGPKSLMDGWEKITAFTGEVEPRLWTRCGKVNYLYVTISLLLKKLQ